MIYCRRITVLYAKVLALVMLLVWGDDGAGLAIPMPAGESPDH